MGRDRPGTRQNAERDLEWPRLETQQLQSGVGEGGVRCAHVCAQGSDSSQAHICAQSTDGSCRVAQPLVLSPRRFLRGTYVHVRAELDKKALPLEAQLPHFCPVEGVDLRKTLRREASAGEPGTA